MATIVVSESSTNVILTWVALSTADTNGDAVTQYRVKLLNKLTSTYEEKTTLCNPTLALTCSIPMSEFTSTLGYAKGIEIFAVVAAQNVQGYGTDSTPNTSGVKA